MRPWTGESVADGRYAIGDVLGRGRDARVHRAEDRVLHRSVAVKFFPTTASGRTPTRWRREAAALDRLDHQHIVRLLDGGETVDAAFLVLPLLPGTLASRLAAGPMSRAEAARTAIALAGALGRVHRAGLVHGDVDVDGVLIDELGLPCWSGLPDPITGTHDRATERDLAGLAALAVRCVTGDRTATTTPAVLDTIRAAAVAPETPGLHDRLTSALEAAAPARMSFSAAPFVAAARRRARPGFAAVLGLGFAASVLAGLVVDTGTWRATIGDGLENSPEAAVLSDDPASSDIAASVRDAIGRLGSLPEGPTAPSHPAVAAHDSGPSDPGPSDSPDTADGTAVAGVGDDATDPAGSTTSGEPAGADPTHAGAQQPGGATGEGGADELDESHQSDRAVGSDDRDDGDADSSGGGGRGDRDDNGDGGRGDRDDGGDGGRGDRDDGGLVELRADGHRADRDTSGNDDSDAGHGSGDGDGGDPGESDGHHDALRLLGDLV